MGATALEEALCTVPIRLGGSKSAPRSRKNYDPTNGEFITAAPIVWSDLGFVRKAGGPWDPLRRDDGFQHHLKSPGHLPALVRRCVSQIRASRWHFLVRNADEAKSNNVGRTMIEAMRCTLLPRSLPYSCRVAAS